MIIADKVSDISQILNTKGSNLEPGKSLMKVLGVVENWAGEKYLEVLFPSVYGEVRKYVPLGVIPGDYREGIGAGDCFTVEGNLGTRHAVNLVFTEFERTSAHVEKENPLSRA